MGDPHFRPPSVQPGVDQNQTFTSGVTGFDDTFFGPNDKNYLDRKVKAMSRLRGTDVYYYKLQSQTARIDGSRPLTDGPEVVPEQTDRRRTGNVSLYGEPVIIRNRINAVKREVIPDWNYEPPVLIRALAMEPGDEEDPDERGTVFLKTVVLHIGRVLLDEASIIPREGDVIRLPIKPQIENDRFGGFADGRVDSFFDVKHVDRNDHRFGAFGFFAAYKMDLTRNSMFDPERKLDGGT